MIRDPPTGTGRQVIDLIGDSCRGGTDIKPLLLTLVLFGWRVAGCALINRWVPALLA